MRASLVAPILSTLWLTAVAIPLSIAWNTTSFLSAAAGITCAFAVALPALMLMVLSHSPAKTVAEIIRDAEVS